MPNTANTGESSLLSILAHLCALFTSLCVSILGPIVILAIADNDVVKQNARESLNFQLTMIIFALASIPLIFAFGIGFVTLFIVAIWSLVSPIIAMIKVANHPETPHRYAMIFHFFR
jgi:uncharacterized Tic20 family protein